MIRVGSHQLMVSATEIRTRENYVLLTQFPSSSRHIKIRVSKVRPEERSIDLKSPGNCCCEVGAADEEPRYRSFI